MENFEGDTAWRQIRDASDIVWQNLQRNNEELKTVDCTCDAENIIWENTKGPLRGLPKGVCSCDPTQLSDWFEFYIHDLIATATLVIASVFVAVLTFYTTRKYMFPSRFRKGITNILSENNEIGDHRQAKVKCCTKTGIRSHLKRRRQGNATAMISVSPETSPDVIPKIPEVFEPRPIEVRKAFSAPLPSRDDLVGRKERALNPKVRHDWSLLAQRSGDGLNCLLTTAPREHLTNSASWPIVAHHWRQ